MKPTFQQDISELGRTFAAHHGWQGKSGGWIYDHNDRPFVQGYWALGEILAALGIVEVGKGIHWRAQHAVTREPDPAVVGRRLVPIIKHRYFNWKAQS